MPGRDPRPASPARRPRARVATLAAAALLLLGAPPAVAVDWSRYADVDTVTVLTTTEEGETRETTVWLAVVDGQGFIRTGDTRWGNDVARDPTIALRIGEERLPLTAEFVEDEALREQVNAAFREKYGWSDAAIGLFRFGRARIMKLLPREVEEGP